MFSRVRERRQEGCHSRAFPIPVVIQTLDYTTVLAALKPLRCRNMTDSSPLGKDPREGDLNSEPASWVGLGLVSVSSAGPGNRPRTSD